MTIKYRLLDSNNFYIIKNYINTQSVYKETFSFFIKILAIY